MRLWLCVPACQRFVARNWNWASSGCAPTALIVARSFGVSIPFRGLGTAFSTVAVDIVVLLLLVLGGWAAGC